MCTDGSQTKARIQDKKLIINVGGKQRPTTIGQLKEDLKAIEGLSKLQP